MGSAVLDGEGLRRCLENGCRNLRRNRKAIDELNVFPVPDGDTGKNMDATLEGGLRSVGDAAFAGTVLSRFSTGALLSARGNSGVILSQMLRGAAAGLGEKKLITGADLAPLLRGASDAAYASVEKPVEGTMLTVLRRGAEKAEKSGEASLDEVLAAMRTALAETPELLPVLKEAGVTDSGGAGLVCFLEGVSLAQRGTFLEDTEEDASATYNPVLMTNLTMEELTAYGYCTEFVLQLRQEKVGTPEASADEVREVLGRLGSSVVAAGTGTVLKAHVHTDSPEKVLAWARSLGEFLTVKIENMAVQHSETQIQTKRKKIGVVTTAQGSGIARFFREIGADVVIDAGQTNNASTRAFLEAFDEVPAEDILVLPNNSNLFLTAHQAAELYTAARVHVVETRSVAEGYSALSMADFSRESVEKMLEDMTDPLSRVITGYVAQATRDACMNGVSVKKGEYLGHTDDLFLCAASTPEEAALGLVERLPDVEDKEVLTVFCGADADAAQRAKLKRELEDRWPLMEISMLDGEQTIYPFILSVE